jgi:cell division protein FtsI (penicillin-binding protein 3)
MANIPTYDPNNRGQLHGEKLRNRVFTDMFEPGSTLKPFGVALAMDQGKVKASTKIDTGNGRMSIGPATISDTKPHGVMTVEEIIQKSSNVGTSKIVLELERKDLWDFFNLLGFGQTPSIAFPGSVAGRVRPWNKWRPIEQATMSYGHGISVSLIQLAQSYTIFANKGHFVPASLIKRGPQDPVVSHRVIGEKVADSMLHMLELASGPEGTAIKAQVQGYRVAGKTGTAHKQEGGRYVNKYVSSYVGLAPVSDPRVIVAIMVDEPKGGVYYGGLVAAPVFSTITKSVLTRLNVQPDAIESTEQLRKFVAAPSAAGSRL